MPCRRVSDRAQQITQARQQRAWTDDELREVIAAAQAELARRTRGRRPSAQEARHDR
jgi:hypothetical protein